jgi:hypothetical protein
MRGGTPGVCKAARILHRHARGIVALRVRWIDDHTTKRSDRENHSPKIDRINLTRLIHPTYPALRACRAQSNHTHHLTVTVLILQESFAAEKMVC